MHAAHAHPSSMMPAMQNMVAIDDNMMRSFPIVQVEVKIRVPDQLIGRLIGKNGHCLKKIMDETTTQISINETRSQQHHEVQYQMAEIVDRIITIKGSTLNAVLLAEKNVQHKLRQFYDQDMNINTGHQYQAYGASGVIMNPVENIGPYIAPGSVPAHQMLPRENAAAAAAAYPATAYNAIPMGVSPQPFYIQNPAAVANFTLPTGQYIHQQNISSLPNMPNSVHIKSRVYVPNHIVGILIGSKGQTIKGVIAESGAIISIEGDRDPKKIKKELPQNVTDGASSNNNGHTSVPPVQANQEAAITKQEVPPEGNQSLDLKEIAEVEPVAADNEDKNGQQGEAVIEKDDKSAPALPPADDEQQQKSGTHNQQEVEAGKANQQQEVNGSHPHNTPTAVGTPPVVETHQQFNGGNKRNNNQHLPGPDQRGVFIQGYDYQVAKALYWVFQKVSESQNTRPEEIILTCEAIVPSKVIGRIIGKQGQNVKQLQMRSGASIKVPDDINQHDKNCVEAAVRVVGNFFAVQAVQQHFGSLIADAEWRESREIDERRSRFREGSR